MLAWTPGELMSFSQRGTSRPICLAHSLYLSALSCEEFWKIRSCISQNLPCLPAATAAFAAGMALGCMVAGRGKFLNAKLTSFGYFLSRSSTRLVDLAQKGHWKSENSRIVTLASFGPLTCPAVTGMV